VRLEVSGGVELRDVVRVIHEQRVRVASAHADQMQIGLQPFDFLQGNQKDKLRGR
jgi:hypothetical protein